MTLYEWIAVAAVAAAIIALIHHFGLAALRKDIQAMFGAASGTPVVVNVAAASPAPAPAAAAPAPPAVAPAPAAAPAPGPSITDQLFKPAAPVASSAPAAPAAPAVDETTLELGTSFGIHPRVNLGPGESKVKNFGPFPVDTRVRVQTVEMFGNYPVRLDAIDPTGAVLATMTSITSYSEVTILAAKGVVYGARTTNLSQNENDVHIQMYPG